MRHMGLQKEEVAAFGDNFNDETMLDAVGYPFLMKAAHPDLHKPGYHFCHRVIPVLRSIAGAGGDPSVALQALNG